MNIVELVGRLTGDPQTKFTTGENANASCRFTVAVNRQYKNKETGNYDADFIGCVAFGPRAEFVGKYFHKGDPIGITGEIRTGSYTKNDGVKVYTTDVVANNIEFVGSKGSGANESASAATRKPSIPDSLVNVPDDSEEQLPW